MTTKQSLAARCRALAHDEYWHPESGYTFQGDELISIAVELERLAWEMRVPHQADPSDEAQALEPFYSQRDVDTWAAALADPKEG